MYEWDKNNIESATNAAKQAAKDSNKVAYVVFGLPGGYFPTFQEPELLSEYRVVTPGGVVTSIIKEELINPE